jgi:hypothetical protein
MNTISYNACLSYDLWLPFNNIFQENNYYLDICFPFINKLQGLVLGIESISCLGKKGRDCKCAMKLWKRISQNYTIFDQKRRSWAPPWVKFHIWLACQDRCWTGERLARRRLPHPPRCPLCDQSEETMQHLMAGCPFSRTVWYEVLSWIRSTARPPRREDDFVEWWTRATRSTLRAVHKGTSSLIMLTAWWIWKHHNAVVFDSALPDTSSLFKTIRSEAQAWASAGAIGIRALIPAAA